MLLPFCAVGAGGCLGACLRFLISKTTVSHASFPWGTLLSNVLAGLLIGLIIGIERHYGTLNEQLKLFATVGFLGGLSTFSAFSLETVSMIENGFFLKAAVNTALNVTTSFLAVAFGLFVVRLLNSSFGR
ncbi:MAG: fluoride efflux transporter FluC [Sphaerochaetaceae bacterium]